MVCGAGVGDEAWGGGVFKALQVIVCVLRVADLGFKGSTLNLNSPKTPQE